METEEYLKLAAVEDRMWYFRALHAHVERELARRIEPDASLIDAGCGTAGLIRRMASCHPAWRWTGVDVSATAIDLARRRCPDTVELREASVDALPFADGSFSGVVSADVLYHVDDDQAALREFFRVLRPGGVVVVNVPAYQWLWSYHDEATHARRRYARADVLTKLGVAGFVEAHVTHWNSVALPMIIARRKLLPPPKGGSDVQLFPAPVETAFDWAMAAERAWLRAFKRLPFGCSVLAVAVKPDAPPR